MRWMWAWYQPPDGPGSGSADPPAPPSSSSDAAGPDEPTLDPSAEVRLPTPPPEAGEDEDEDLEIEPEADSQAAPDPERWKKVVAALNKAKRRLQRLTPLKERLKGRDLDELEYAARSWQQLQALARTDPTAFRQAIARLVPEDAGEPSARAAEPGDLPPFDPKALPFDPEENPVNRWFADHFARQHALHRDLVATQRQLTQRLVALERHLAGRAEGEVRGRWKSVIDAAAGQIKHEGVRKMFQNQCALYYEVSRLRGQAIDPKEVVERSLQALGIRGPAASVAKAAAAQRMAEQNRQLPRGAALGAGGTPAPARERRHETVADIARRVLGRSV